jgi:hypothetical protein
MDSPVDRYLDAYAAFCRAETQFANICELICTVGEAMKERLPAFLHVAHGFPLPTGEYYDEDLEVNMTEWPTARQIEEAVHTWREAYSRAMHAWQAVPVERRHGLVELPDEIARDLSLMLRLA